MPNLFRISQEIEQPRRLNLDAFLIQRRGRGLPCQRHLRNRLVLQQTSASHSAKRPPGPAQWSGVPQRGRSSRRRQQCLFANFQVLPRLDDVFLIFGIILRIGSRATSPWNPMTGRVFVSSPSLNVRDSPVSGLRGGFKRFRSSMACGKSGRGVGRLQAVNIHAVLNLWHLQHMATRAVELLQECLALDAVAGGPRGL